MGTVHVYPLFGGDFLFFIGEAGAVRYLTFFYPPPPSMSFSPTPIAYFIDETLSSEPCN